MEDPVEKLRKQVTGGVHGLLRLFHTMNATDNDRKMNRQEFYDAIGTLKVKMERTELDDIFKRFDTNGSGSLEFKEFLIALRPSMSESRKATATSAFAKLDHSGDGSITLTELEKRATAFEKNHGGKTMTELLAIFDKDKDDKVSEQEFTQYCAAVNAFTDDDARFNAMIGMGEM